MKLTCSKYAGFCPGVRLAEKAVRDLIARGGSRIYTLGDLIHNRLYNEELSSLGVGSIALEEVEAAFLEDPQTPMTVVIRTHGITKEDNAYLLSLSQKYSGLSVVDATCRYVKKIQ